MDNKENTQDLEINKILDEFHNLPSQTDDLPAVDTSEVDGQLAEEIKQVNAEVAAAFRRSLEEK